GNAPHFGEFPALSQVACAHLGIGLEATAGENHRFTVQILEPLWALDGHPNHVPLLVLQQPHTLGGIAHLYTQTLRCSELLIGEALAGPDGFHQEATPEIVLITALKRLAPKGEYVAHAA